MNARWQKTDWLVLLGILAVASFFRLWQLHDVPPGFQFDEAYNAADALRVLAGERPLFFEANGGREALHIYWLAPFVASLGATAFALRLASAVLGIASVGLSFLLWRQLLGDRFVAALAAALMAISYWHIHFSRYGIRAILMPMLLTLTVYFLWQATMPGARREWVIARAAKNWRASAPRSVTPAILCGVFLGLSAYAHPAARFMPLMVVAWFAWLGWQAGERSALRYFADWKAPVRTLPLLVIGFTACLVFLPLAAYFFQNPQSFFGHPTVVAITDQRVSEGNVFVALASNVVSMLGMFFVSGDQAWIHNLSGRPVFDWLLAPFFLVGLAVWAQKIRARDPAAVLILSWMALMLLPTLLSDGAPNFSRAIGILPALFVLPAWGIARALKSLKLHAPRAASHWPVAPVLSKVGVWSVLILLASALFTFNDYFVRFPAQPATYVAYDVDKIDALQQLRSLSAAERVYLPPLWSQHATFALLARDAGFKSFDNGEVMVLPARDAQRGMVYAFPAKADPAYMEWFEHTYGSLTRKQTSADALGQPLLIAYHIAPQDIPPDPAMLPAALPVAPQRIVNIDYQAGIRLVGYRIAAPQSSEQPYQLTLVWQAQTAIAQDYTLFIHLNDASGRAIAQRDRRPGNGSYPTSAWSPGDTVIETYELAPKGASGALQFAVGWYQHGDGARVPVLDASGRVLNDEFVFSAEGTN